MKKLLLILALLSADSFASAKNFCDEVKRIRVWANGSDTYGVWAELKNNPSQCPGGFYLNHNATNKQFIYSLILAAKASNQRICFQVYDVNSKIENRCRIHYTMHE